MKTNAPNPIKTTTQLTAASMKIEAVVTEPRMRFIFTDMFHSDLCTCDTSNDVLNFCVELPDSFPETYQVLHNENDCPLKDVKHGILEWAEESWIGKRFLHIQINFTHCSLKTKGLEFHFEVKAARTDQHNATADYQGKMSANHIKSRMSED